MCSTNYNLRYRPVCGPDGKTYYNRGVLQSAACINNDPMLNFYKHKGECEFGGK